MYDFVNDKIFKNVEGLLFDSNLFSILKFDSTEIRHTNMIEWLLSLDNSRGLKELIKFCNKKIDLNKIDYDNINYYNDRPFNQIFVSSDISNRPDLLIEFNYLNDKEKYYILIENKINAFENEYENGKYQTTLYREEMIRLDIKNVIYIFLDTKGNKSNCKDYININYDTFYNEILKKIIEGNVSDKEKLIYNEYINSLKRPSFDKDDIITDDIYVFDKKELNEFKDFYIQYKDSINIFLNNYSKEEIKIYEILKYIIYSISYKKVYDVGDKIIDCLNLSTKRSSYKWSYNGVYSTNIDLVKKLCEDLINDDSIYFELIKDIKVGADRLLINNLDDEAKTPGWEKYLIKNTNKKIDDFYVKLDTRKKWYLRNYIGYDTMKEISNMLSDNKYKIELIK